MDARDVLAAGALCIVAVSASANSQGTPSAGNGTFVVVDANNQEIGWVVANPLSDAPSVIRDVQGAPLIALFLDSGLGGIVRAHDQTRDALYFATNDCSGEAFMLAATSSYVIPRTFAIQGEPVVVPDESAAPAIMTTRSQRIAQNTGICYQLVSTTEFVPTIQTSYVLPTFARPFRLTTRARSAPSLAAMPPWSAPLLAGMLLGLSMRRLHASSKRRLP